MCRWKTYLLWFAQEHISFRYAEIDSLVSLLNIDMKYVLKPKEEEPYCIVEFQSETDVRQLTNRSVSLRNTIELYTYATSINELHEKMKVFPRSILQPYLNKNMSFKIDVETFNRHFTQKQKVDKLEKFEYLPIKGPVNLKNPDVIFQYIEYYGTRANNPPENPYQVFFGRFISCGLRDLIKKLSLKTRKYIGNTSMDPQLSLLMANQAKIKNGDIVLDPFVGSGSLLVAAAQFGGYVYGGDIDYLMLHAKTRPSRISQKKREADESIRANMKQYNLEHRYLDVLINDFSTVFWKSNMKFDAIITDPPYGIREATERVGTEKEDCKVKDEHLSTHIPAKIEYTISQIYSDLLIFSSKYLKIGGRLVCWFPVYRDDYLEDGLPSHPALKLISNSEQTLTMVTSRRLLTFEKIREPTEDELNKIDSNITDFREKYYVNREETRKERRMREAKIREENKTNYFTNKDKK